MYIQIQLSGYDLDTLKAEAIRITTILEDVEGLKEIDQIAYIRFALVYLGLDDLDAIRNELDRLMES